MAALTLRLSVGQSTRLTRPSVSRRSTSCVMLDRTQLNRLANSPNDNGLSDPTSSVSTLYFGLESSTAASAPSSRSSSACAACSNEKIVVSLAVLFGLAFAATSFMHELYSIRTIQSSPAMHPKSRAPLARASLHRHRLRQISRLVHVQAALHRDVVREQLKRNDRQDRVEHVDRLGDPNLVVDHPLEHRLVLARDADDLAAARFHFLNVRHDFVEHRVVRGDEHHGHLRVDQRDRSMLHLGRRIALGVDVADLFQ